MDSTQAAARASPGHKRRRRRAHEKKKKEEEEEGRISSSMSKCLQVLVRTVQHEKKNVVVSRRP